MLVMQAHVIRQHVQRTVVRERLGHGRVGQRIFGACRQFLEGVVLGYEMACAGVEGARKEGGEDKVVDGVSRAGLDEDGVEEDLYEDVDKVDGGEGDGVDEYWSDGVEEDLEGAEEGFA